MRDKKNKVQEPIKIKIPEPSKIDHVSPIDLETAKHLATSEKLSKITTLDLEDSLIGDEGVTALLSSTHLKNLFRLYLTHTNISDAVCSSLAQAPSLKSLQELRLSRNKITAEGLKIFLASPHLKHLEALDLDETNIGDDGLEALAQTPLPMLRVLSLRWCSVTSRGVASLNKAPWIKHLQRLSLNHNPLFDAGLEALSKSSFPVLESLSLGWISATNTGVSALVRAEWPGLQSLDLRGNALTDIAAEFMARSSSRLPKINRLLLRLTSISQKGEKSLVHSLAGVRGVQLAPLSPDVLLVCSFCRTKTTEAEIRCHACEHDLTEGGTFESTTPLYKSQHRVTCHHCGAQRFEESQRCPSCKRWGQPL